MLPRVVVAMSGGVDSSVAAYLLKAAGHEVVGITMCLGVFGSEDDAACCGAQAIADARRVCDRLDIPHYVLDFGTPFREKVINGFIEEYRRGRTPNPCIDCNRFLKFDLLLHKARAMGFDRLATGHYARLASHGPGLAICRPKDRRKDQSYFLYCIRKEVLPSILFPLGEYTKEEVRSIARGAALPVADKSESQDICFAEGADYTHFLAQNGIEEQPGDIVDVSGSILGRHNGICRYTVGQRKGLGIAAAQPLYVISLDPAANRVVVGSRGELSARDLIADDLNFFVTELSGSGLCGQIRYAHRCAPCEAAVVNGRLHVRFDEPQEAITPGQSVVLYRADVLVAGGVIRCATQEESNDHGH